MTQLPQLANRVGQSSQFVRRDIELVQEFVLKQFLRKVSQTLA